MSASSGTQEKKEKLADTTPVELATVMKLLTKFDSGTPSKCGKFVTVRKLELQECIVTLKRYIDETNALELTAKEMLELKKNSESFGSQADMVLTHNLFGSEAIPHLNIVGSNSTGMCLCCPMKLWGVFLAALLGGLLGLVALGLFTPCFHEVFGIMTEHEELVSSLTGHGSSNQTVHDVLGIAHTVTGCLQDVGLATVTLFFCIGAGLATVIYIIVIFASCCCCHGHHRRD